MASGLHVGWNCTRQHASMNSMHATCREAAPTHPAARGHGSHLDNLTWMHLPELAVDNGGGSRQGVGGLQLQQLGGSNSKSTRGTDEQSLEESGLEASMSADAADVAVRVSVDGAPAAALAAGESADIIQRAMAVISSSRQLFKDGLLQGLTARGVTLPPPVQPVQQVQVSEADALAAAAWPAGQRPPSSDSSSSGVVGSGRGSNSIIGAVTASHAETGRHWESSMPLQSSITAARRHSDVGRLVDAYAGLGQPEQDLQQTSALQASAGGGSVDAVSVQRAVAAADAITASRSRSGSMSSVRSTSSSRRGSTAAGAAGSMRQEPHLQQQQQQRSHVSELDHQYQFGIVGHKVPLDRHFTGVVAGTAILTSGAVTFTKPLPAADARAVDSARASKERLKQEEQSRRYTATYGGSGGGAAAIMPAGVGHTVPQQQQQPEQQLQQPQQDDDVYALLSQSLYTSQPPAPVIPPLHLPHPSYGGLDARVDARPQVTLPSSTAATAAAQVTSAFTNISSSSSGDTVFAGLQSLQSNESAPQPSDINAMLSLTPEIFFHQQTQALPQAERTTRDGSSAVQASRSVLQSVTHSQGSVSGATGDTEHGGVSLDVSGSRVGDVGSVGFVSPPGASVAGRAPDQPSVSAQHLQQGGFGFDPHHFHAAASTGQRQSLNTTNATAAALNTSTSSTASNASASRLARGLGFASQIPSLSPSKHTSAAAVSAAANAAAAASAASGSPARSQTFAASGGGSSSAPVIADPTLSDALAHLSVPIGVGNLRFMGPSSQQLAQGAARIEMSRWASAAGVERYQSSSLQQQEDLNQHQPWAKHPQHQSQPSPSSPSSSSSAAALADTAALTDMHLMDISAIDRLNASNGTISGGDENGADAGRNARGAAGRHATSTATGRHPYSSFPPSIDVAADLGPLPVYQHFGYDLDFKQNSGAAMAGILGGPSHPAATAPASASGGKPQQPCIPDREQSSLYATAERIHLEDPEATVARLRRRLQAIDDELRPMIEPYLSPPRAEAPVVVMGAGPELGGAQPAMVAPVSAPMPRSGPHSYDAHHHDSGRDSSGQLHYGRADISAVHMPTALPPQADTGSTLHDVHAHADVQDSGDGDAVPSQPSVASQLAMSAQQHQQSQPHQPPLLLVYNPAINAYQAAPSSHYGIHTVSEAAEVASGGHKQQLAASSWPLLQPAPDAALEPQYQDQLDGRKRPAAASSPSSRRASAVSSASSSAFSYLTQPSAAAHRADSGTGSDIGRSRSRLASEDKGVQVGSGGGGGGGTGDLVPTRIAGSGTATAAHSGADTGAAVRVPAGSEHDGRGDGGIHGNGAAAAVGGVDKQQLQRKEAGTRDRPRRHRSGTGRRQAEAAAQDAASGSPTFTSKATVRATVVGHGGGGPAALEASSIAGDRDAAAAAAASVTGSSTVSSMLERLRQARLGTGAAASTPSPAQL